MALNVEVLIEQARSHLRQAEVSAAIELLEKAENLAYGDNEKLALIYCEMAKAYAKTAHDKSVVALVKKAVHLNANLHQECRSWALQLKGTNQKALGKVLLKELGSSSCPSLPNKKKSFVIPKNKVLIVALAVVILMVFVLLAQYPFGSGNKVTPDRLDVDRLRNNVGQVVLVVTVLRSDDFSRVTLPMPLGSCFAVSSSGHLLTNKHITKAYHEQKELKNVLNCRLMVCFGKTPANRYDATIVHESPYLDAALLKIDRHFARPLVTFVKTPCVGDQVYACGFPSKAAELVRSLDYEIILTNWSEQIAKLRSEGTADFFNVLPQSSFEISITGGIISARRTIDDILWVQTDAVIHAGNSGGPLLTPTCEVIAINTLGHNESESTNFSLLANQLRSEFSPWVHFN